MNPVRIPLLPFAALLVVLAAVPLHAQCEVLKRSGPQPFVGKPRFGFSVSLSDDRMAVGIPGAIDPGSAEIFERSPTGAWISAGMVISSDGEPYDQFGYSVAIDGEVLVVGAIADGTLGAKGAAYVFERQPDGTWLETTKFVPPDVNAWAFGWAIDLDGDRFVVGAKGASDLGGGKGMVFVYEREGASWVYKKKIVPSISVGGDGFGADLDLDGDRLVVGASYSWTMIPPFEGRAFVFDRTETGNWVEVGALQAADSADADDFGSGVGVDGDRVVVGAPFHDVPLSSIGAAYVFDVVEGEWKETAKILPPALPSSTRFGWSVDVQGERLLIGATTDSDIAPAAGAAYVFVKQPEGWTPTIKIYGSGVIGSATFGYSVQLDSPNALVGAPSQGSGPISPGHAFLFALDGDGPHLVTDRDEVSLSQGGDQLLQMSACPEHAGDLHVLAGTAAGTTPGFLFAGQQVPLNPDAYFLHTIQHLTGPPLLGGLGVLDFNGFGEATFSLPPGIEPALAGLVLHHAYAVFDAATLQLMAVSPAVSVSLLP